MLFNMVSHWRVITFHWKLGENSSTVELNGFLNIKIFVLKFKIHCWKCSLSSKKYNNYKFGGNGDLFFFFFGLHPRHMEVPRLGVKSELQLPAYPRATAQPDLSRICHPHPSSQQLWILNPLSQTRDGTHNLMDTAWVCHRWDTTGTPMVGMVIWLHI